MRLLSFVAKVYQLITLISVCILLKNNDNEVYVLFYLFSTTACHLCDQAKSTLLALKDQLRSEGLNWDFSVIDISENDGLFERYGVRIPVLLSEGAERDLAWPFEPADAKAYVLKYL